LQGKYQDERGQWLFIPNVALCEDMTPECTFMKLSFTASRAKLELKKEREVSPKVLRKTQIDGNNNNNIDEGNGKLNHLSKNDSNSQNRMRVMENWKKVMQMPQRGELELRSQYF
jgi:hypothetical protein